MPIYPNPIDIRIGNTPIDSVYSGNILIWTRLKLMSLEVETVGTYVDDDFRVDINGVTMFNPKMNVGWYSNLETKYRFKTQSEFSSTFVGLLPTGTNTDKLNALFNTSNSPSLNQHSIVYTPYELISDYNVNPARYRKIIFTPTEELRNIIFPGALVELYAFDGWALAGKTAPWKATINWSDGTQTIKTGGSDNGEIQTYWQTTGKHANSTLRGAAVKNWILDYFNSMGYTNTSDINLINSIDDSTFGNYYYRCGPYDSLSNETNRAGTYLSLGSFILNK